jgi:hypothetical protein
MKSQWTVRVAMLTCAFVVAGALAMLDARQQASPAQQAADQIAIDADDIAGVVTSSSGAEAGVWVIAETSDLPTKYRKIVVTDDLGRFVLPDLPNANYRVWVRGYGLIDSGLTVSRPGAHLALGALKAPTAKAAAEYYPANYWLALMQVPPKAAFPMAGVPGAPQGVQTQADWVSAYKRCAGVCHQMGNKVTREINPAMGKFDSTIAAWDYRIRMGQVGSNMLRSVTALGKERALSIYADWTDRIAAGEVPETPPRPSGVERNLVLTMWDVGRPVTFLHDTYATDKRNPTVNAYGPVYGGDYNEGILTVLDPVKNTAQAVQIPILDDRKNMTHSANITANSMEHPSLYWGDEIIYDEIQRTEVKNVDPKGRLWMMTSFRANDNQPAWCKAGSGNKFAENFPILSSQRQIAVYDPKTKKFTYIDTCFSTHHAAYGEDRDNMYYNAGPDGGLLSWVNTRVFEETGSAEKAQGWCPAYYDTNGNGKYDKGIDTLEVNTGYYVTFNPKDKSVWYVLPGTPGKLVRMDIGSNPPETCKSEIYEPPFYSAKAPGKLGFFPRGVDVDRDTGLIWTGLAGSGQLASFDRTKCKIFSGPEMIDGQHCIEGWTLYDLPGPNMKGLTDGGTSDFIYGNWVDQFDTLGLGKNVPLVNGTNSDSLIALMPATKKWVVLRVPYPLGFHTRNMAGRIDDPAIGWKGRGLWAGNENRSPWHIEGGKGTTPHDVHFQMRPDPLAH